MSFVKSPSALVGVVPPLMGDTLHAALTFIITVRGCVCSLTKGDFFWFEKGK